MDVVRASIESIGGTIDVISRPGEGTTFKIRIPLTLAIIPALMVEEHGERYAIPQVNLLELVRLRASDRDRLESVQDAPVFRLRGRLLPLLFLGEQLGLSPKGSASERECLHLAVVQSDGRRFGVVFESVHDTEEIVVKPLADCLRPIGIYAGATILGDGRAALILDVPGLARRVGLSTRAAEAEPLEAASPSFEQLLLVSVREGWPAAVPIARVSRIEEVAGSAIEFADQSPAVQWRGSVLPVVSLASALACEPARFDRERAYHLLVHTRGARPIGFLVEKVEDIVESALQVDWTQARGAVMGRVVLNGRVTDLVDIDLLADVATEGAAKAA
jgi:two-component system chemotaxis sensor kinase CheA